MQDLSPVPLSDLLPYAEYLTTPPGLLAGFILASLLMIWRLQAVERKGFEGTVLGTLIMPYCSGAANLMFAFVMSRAGNNGRLVIENSLVNNVTNLTLILGLALLLHRSASEPAGAGGRARIAGDSQRLSRLELLFTLIALFLFTGTTWALGKDGVLDFYDGLVLVGLFVFWQVLHVFEVLKNNVRKNRSLHWSILVDLALIGVGAWIVYLSVEQLVGWVESGGGGLFQTDQLGWLSGALMVLPNAFLALYYSRAGRQDIVVSSQVGDGHICIPMCIGLFALFDPIRVPDFFETGVVILLAAGATHFLSLMLLGRLPRMLGYVLLAGYGVFLYRGLVHG